jgi:uncharacterized protein (TIGR01244 family)
MLPPMFIRITDQLSVAPQISAADVAQAAAEGFTAIVNNRPDGESFDQPPGAEIAAAAAAAGLAYVAIPIDQSGFSPDHVAAMADVLAAHPHVLAFCRSGTRSCNLWALAAASRGGDPEAIISAAEGGGYNVAGLTPILRQLSRA